MLKCETYKLLYIQKQTPAAFTAAELTRHRGMKASNTWVPLQGIKSQEITYWGCEGVSMTKNGCVKERAVGRKRELAGGAFKWPREGPNGTALMGWWGVLGLHSAHTHFIAPTFQWRSNCIGVFGLLHQRHLLPIVYTWPGSHIVLPAWPLEKTSKMFVPCPLD